MDTTTFSINLINASISSWSTLITSIATICIAIFTFKLLYQIKLAKEQLNSSNQWNKLNASFSFFSIDRFHINERKVVEEFKQMGIDFHSIEGHIPDKAAEKIYDNSDSYRELKNYINVFEEYSIAVNMGVLDEDCSYHMLGALLPSVQSRFSPFINLIRKKQKDNTIYLEIEKLAIKWNKRSEEEGKKELDELEKLKDPKGAKKIF